MYSEIGRVVWDSRRGDWQVIVMYVPNLSIKPAFWGDADAIYLNENTAKKVMVAKDPFTNQKFKPSKGDGEWLPQSYSSGSGRGMAITSGSFFSEDPRKCWSKTLELKITALNGALENSPMEVDLDTYENWRVMSGVGFTDKNRGYTSQDKVAYIRIENKSCKDKFETDTFEKGEDTTILQIVVRSEEECKKLATIFRDLADKLESKKEITNYYNVKENNEKIKRETINLNSVDSE